ncbi:MAG: Zn-ribbon domain-containing OB-fold protein [Halanaeroarchaeum sp.]
MGAYISVPTWWRNLPSRYRLAVGECPECGAVNFPPEGACKRCGALVDYDVFEPAGTGEIVAKTIIEGGAPPEFADLLAQQGSIGVVVVDLDEGARVPGMLTDVDPETVGRGDRVEAVVRRLYTQEGIPRYGFKFRPAAGD